METKYENPHAMMTKPLPLVYHLTYQMRMQLAGRTEYHDQTAGYTLSAVKAEAHKRERDGHDYCTMPVHCIEAHDLDAGEQAGWYDAMDAAGLLAADGVSRVGA